MPLSVLNHVHETHEGVATIELSPPHAPREDTPAYKKAHHQLVSVEDQPCFVCGVRQSTLSDSTQNRYGSSALETHHRVVELSLLNACDWRKIAADFPEVKGPEDLETWVNSPANLIVLCDIHHRHPERGIHHLTESDFLAQKYLLDGYQVAARAQDAAQVLAKDEQLLEQEEGNHAPTVS